MTASFWWRPGAAAKCWWPAFWTVPTTTTAPLWKRRLRQSQAREQAAREAAERERNLLETVLAQAPVAIGIFQGDDQVVHQANDRLCCHVGLPPPKWWAGLGSRACPSCAARASRS
ncbi:MAG: hypothetical protein WKG07_39135 [Hymenobacter sp.]